MRRAFAGCVAVLVIVAFAGFYGYGIVLCWKASAQKPPIFKPEYVYVATALAGLIGGVTAMVFNEKLPDAPPRPTRPSTENPSTPSASGLAAGLSAIKRSIIGTRTDLLTIVSAAYVAVYFVTCIGAIVL